MKHILNKKGVTVLEGLIALALLAMVAVGTFGVLLSSSRKSSTPDLREDMLYSIERAHRALQTFSPSLEGSSVPRDSGFLQEMRASTVEEDGHYYTIHRFYGDNHPSGFWNVLDNAADRNGFNQSTLCGPDAFGCIGRAKDINIVGMSSVLCSPAPGANTFTYTVTNYASESSGPTIEKMEALYGTNGLEAEYSNALLRRIDFHVICKGATL